MSTPLKHTLLSVFSGLLMALAWPAVGGLTPLIFVALVPLLRVEHEVWTDKANGVRRRIFPKAYLAFLAFNLASTWWVCNATLAGGLAASVCNALFMAIVFQGFHFVKRKVGIREGAFGLVFFWMSFEWIHLTWEFTWPWLTLGNVFANNITWIQWYEYTGVFGGTLWILVANLLAFSAVRRWLNPDSHAGSKWLPTGFLIGIIVLPILIGVVRYYNYEDKGHDIDVVVIQPNINPYKKFRTNAIDQLKVMLQLAEPLLDKDVDYLVLPETALPETIVEERYGASRTLPLLKTLTRNFPQLNVVTGLSTLEFIDGEQPKPRAGYKTKSGYWRIYYNAATQVNNQVDTLPFYHKSKLVPGVELLPYPEVFGFLDAIEMGGGHIGSNGTQDYREVFPSPYDSTKVAPVICYESIFGEFVGEYMHAGANVIFIVTNDGWWKDTPGYKQHLAYGRLRAIETRKSIARSANTGISCFINQRGDVSQATGWWEPIAIRETIKANSEMTFYTAYGDYLARIPLLFSPLLLLLAIVRKFAPRK